MGCELWDTHHSIHYIFVFPGDQPLASFTIFFLHCFLLLPQSFNLRDRTFTFTEYCMLGTVVGMSYIYYLTQNSSKKWEETEVNRVTCPRWLGFQHKAFYDQRPCFSHNIAASLPCPHNLHSIYNFQ